MSEPLTLICRIAYLSESRTGWGDLALSRQFAMLRGFLGVGLAVTGSFLSGPLRVLPLLVGFALYMAAILSRTGHSLRDVHQCAKDSLFVRLNYWVAATAVVAFAAVEGSHRSTLDAKGASVVAVTLLLTLLLATRPSRSVG